MGILYRNNLQHGPTICFETTLQRGKIIRPIGFTNCLKHFDGDDAVELTFNIAVILKTQINCIALAGLSHPCIRPCKLRRRQGDTSYVGIAMFRQIARKGTPTTADFQNFFAAFECQLFSNALQLIFLRSFKCGRLFVPDRR